ncbi:Protein scd2/ral3 [Cyphellophora attinorum]|uniref:Protein scd2/ral3 n=1 Tax=Cyphellophora attinorum TaxID=1664694 RepID=A0A0N1HD93_9EURO|nr:Protein scd2/ral3 [Phialophora attinorum]KPI42905.1 Protein scd2/ral3 [Phialophora attinorum]
MKVSNKSPPPDYCPSETRWRPVLFVPGPQNAIRRSLKGDKDQSKPPHFSLTAKTATSIVPPKKVIKALYDYEPQNKNGQELAFHKGDFFHVLSREDDTEWYEACNPLIPTARGLVPVAFFEEIGKTQRQSGQSIASASERTDDSGISDVGTNSQHHRSASSATTKPSHQRGLSAIMGGKTTGAMVYGVVQYDFNAERADELEAKAGEAIIVVAQSNPEWFVAKPIGRLGGPGLIPVSFVDIKDTATMQSVPDPLEAVRKAGVPRVEEWKKFAAEYKNSSISLGKFDGSVQQATNDMGRMSIQNAQGKNIYPPSMSGPDPNLPPAPIQASVPRYCFDNDMYWYIIECQLDDGRWFELSRYYADFYDLQIALIEAFPVEAGNRKEPRTLPFMPGPVAHVTDAISNGRRQNLDDYIKQIIAMPPHISKSILVRNLFKPKPGQDFEIDPNALNDDYRLSGGSQQSLQRIQSNQQQATRQTSNPQMGNGGGGYGGMGPPPPVGPGARMSHQRQQPSVGGGGYGGLTSPVNPGDRPYLNPQASQSSGMNASAAGGAGGQLKVKVVFQNDTFVMRFPQDIGFMELKDRLKQRFKIGNAERVSVRYEDRGSGNSLVELDNDRALDAAIDRSQGALKIHVEGGSGSG